MIEELSRAVGGDVPRETVQKLEHYVALLLVENDQQNLIARSTIDQLWRRHILDSAQLLRFAPPGARWLDIGSGAGLPGIVLAILGVEQITLSEPRRLRAEFLRRCADELGLSTVTVAGEKIERLTGKFDVITARAVASVERLFAAANHLSHPETVWVLPKGRSGEKELAEALRTWQGRFRAEPSTTEGDAVILVGTGVSARRKGRE